MNGRFELVGSATEMSNNWPRTCLCIRTHSASCFQEPKLPYGCPIRQHQSVKCSSKLSPKPRPSLVSRQTLQWYHLWYVMLFLRGLRNRERLFLLERLFVTTNLGAVGFRGDLEALL